MDWPRSHDNITGAAGAAACGGVTAGAVPALSAEIVSIMVAMARTSPISVNAILVHSSGSTRERPMRLVDRPEPRRRRDRAHSCIAPRPFDPDALLAWPRR